MMNTESFGEIASEAGLKINLYLANQNPEFLKGSIYALSEKLKDAHKDFTKTNILIEVFYPIIDDRMGKQIDPHLKNKIKSLTNKLDFFQQLTTEELEETSNYCYSISRNAIGYRYYL